MNEPFGTASVLADDHRRLKALNLLNKELCNARLGK